MAAYSRSEKLEMDVNQSTAGVSDYFELLKPRVMSLAIFTAIIGSRKPQQVAAFAPAADLKLSQDHLSRLTEASNAFPAVKL